jgi:hypothetical protein
MLYENCNKIICFLDVCKVLKSFNILDHLVYVLIVSTVPLLQPAFLLSSTAVAIFIS